MSESKLESGQMDDSKEPRNEATDAGGDSPAAGAAGETISEADEVLGDAPEDRVTVLERERQKLKDQLLRTAADFDNFRKRTKRDLEEAERRGREEALREILPVIDNLERAVAAADSADDVKAVAEGVRMVLKYFEDTASKIGLTRVKTQGERFDPSLHDAMQQLETDEHPPGSVVHELVPGYRLGDKLLRPALVVVARPRSTASDAQSPSNGSSSEGGSGGQS